LTAIETVTLVLAAVALAGLIAPRLGIAAALVELCLGIVLGNVAHIDSKTPWLVLLAGFGGMAVTFLAGTEIDAHALRRRPGPALLLGGTAFATPFVVSGTVAWVVLGWSPAASVIAATALSETSLANTYAV
jgi:Kef-type K+ transport system membrane component KefB